MLIISADSDHTVPLGDRERVLQQAEAQQRRDRDRQDDGPRARALTIDAGWREVAEKALEFVARFTSARSRVCVRRALC